MTSNRMIRHAVRLALASGAAAAALYGVAASAQDTADLGAVVVTGTRIQRQDYEATSPVVTLGADQLQQAGTVQIDTVLNQLPQLVPTLSIASNNPSASGGAGQALVDMRGLGVGRTLVLLDGTRLTPSHTSGQIDLNTIPASLIENIEVLTGGAGAVYGSDAIAGVVNVRLKKRFEGIQIDTQYGQTAESDGETTAVDVTMGGNFSEDRGNMVLALSYDERKSILAGDRSFAQLSLAPDLSAFGSATIPEGRYDRTLANLPTQAAMDAVFAGYGVAAGSVLNSDNLGFNSDGTLFDITGTSNYRGEEFVGFNAASFSYNYAPTYCPFEARKPYMHPIHTLAGNPITCYRPHDHVWHKGIQMTMAVLSMPRVVVEGDDLPKAIREAKQGRVEFRTDKTSLVHVPIGKVSFSEEALLENLSALLDAIVREKPAGAKGQFIRSATLTATMGPGIKLDVQPTLSLTAAANV